MAHFAKIENNIVKNVIVVKNEDAPTEEAGQAFIASLGFAGEWVQTSYNKNFRGNYAGIGMSWNGSVFYGPSPYPSWLLDNNGQWNAPTPMPEGNFRWDEPTVQWVLIP